MLAIAKLHSFCIDLDKEEQFSDQVMLSIFDHPKAFPLAVISEGNEMAPRHLMGGGHHKADNPFRQLRLTEDQEKNYYSMYVKVE